MPHLRIARSVAALSTLTLSGCHRVTLTCDMWAVRAAWTTGASFSRPRCARSYERAAPVIGCLGNMGAIVSEFRPCPVRLRMPPVDETPFVKTPVFHVRNGGFVKMGFVGKGPPGRIGRTQTG